MLRLPCLCLCEGAQGAAGEVQGPHQVRAREGAGVRACYWTHLLDTTVSLVFCSSVAAAAACLTRPLPLVAAGWLQVRELLSSLPRDVLFVLRTNALVRSINAELGTHSGTRFRIFGSSAVKGLSIPLSARPPEDAYFLSEIRDYSQRLPDKGRVIQKRTKAEILSHPHASVNQPTAAEAFLFGQEGLPRLKEIRRQLLVADLRLRVWLVDAGIETASWLSNRWRETKALVGEQLVVEQLKVQVEEGEQQQQQDGGGDKDNKQGAAAAEARAPDAAVVTK